jgi:acyl-CoA synthetase (NDP forming)/GNAT superfamily N-acetyltransferase
VLPTVPSVPSVPTPAVDALTRDGSVVTLRPLRPDDAAAVLELHRAAAPRSQWLRFCGTVPGEADRYAQHLMDDPDGHLAVVAEHDGRVVGVASAEPTDRPDEREVALLVADPHQGAGVGTLLLEHVAAVARRVGTRRFTALVATNNAVMAEVFRTAGFTVRLGRPVAGEVEVEMDLCAGPGLTTALAERERLATAASLQPLLDPASVVVVGASRVVGAIGHAVLANIAAAGFPGPVAAVNVHVRPGDHIAGVPAYRELGEVPFTPQLAVIAVPAVEVEAVLERCGSAGVRVAVVLSSGFADVGDRPAQQRLVQTAHRYGMRLVGPNCLGVRVADPAVRLDATFARPVASFPERGIGIATQSGAVGIAVLDEAERRGAPVRAFVSLGNKADVSGNDLLLSWAGDPQVPVIGLYLESIGNPRRFRRIAADLSRTTPVVALRSGRSVAGARAGASHTAAVATPDAAARALFADAGVIDVETTEELVDTCLLLARQPVPAGRRLAILGNAGGPGALAADVAEAAGATLPPLSAALVARLEAVTLGAAACGNPVDLGAEASAGDLLLALRLLLRSGEVDSVLALYAATATRPIEPVVSAVEAAARWSGRPGTVAAALLGAPLPSGGEVPWFDSAEAAAGALARAGRLGAWRARNPRPVAVPDPAPDVPAARALVAAAAVAADGWLDPVVAGQLVEAAGIPWCTARRVQGSAGALAAATAVHGPVAIKSARADLQHKAAAGAVALGVRGSAAVVAAAERVAAAAGSDDLLVQPMAAPGTELLIGATNPAGGVPLVVVGAGGVHEALVADRSIGTLPLATGAAAELLADLRCAPLLAEHDGRRLGREQAADAVERLAALLLALPTLREIEINPLVVTPDGVMALDVRARVSMPGEPAPRVDPVTDDLEHVLP